MEEVAIANVNFVVIW